MSRLAVYVNGVYAGVLEKTPAHGYEFRYDNAYRADASLPAVCLNMPKTEPTFQSERLFPFFMNMLSEGYNRRLQSRMLRIDEDDDFALLSATA